MAKPIPDDPLKYDQAVRELRELVPLGDAEFDSLLEEEKQYAFKVAGVAQARLANDVLTAIADAVEDGSSLDEFIDDVGDKLERAWGGPIPGRLETIFRTNVQRAYVTGKVRMMRDPAVLRDRPYWRYTGTDDDALCPTCEQWIDTVLPAADPWWSNHTPPMHFSCRCGIDPLSPDEAEARGIDDEGPRGRADDGFGDAPDDEDGEEWEPEDEDLLPAVMDIMLDKLERYRDR